jgi:hypothetical protein
VQKGLLSVQEQYLHALLAFQVVVVVAGLVPLLCQCRVDAPRDVHQHGARRGRVDCSHEPLGLHQGVKVRYKRQARYFAWLRPGRVSMEHKVGKRHISVAGNGRFGR